MAATDVHGTQSATVGTEHTLADTSAAATYLFTVDLVNMAVGDVVELRLYKMVLTSGTRRQAYYARFEGAQLGDLIAISVPISTALSDSGAVRATLKQTYGTSRNFDWSLEKFA